MGKKKVIKKFEMLSEELMVLLKNAYPDGFEDNTISFPTPSGDLAIGVRLETDEVDYMIKLPTNAIPDMDDDDDNSSSSSEGKEFVNLDNLQIADEDSDEEED